MSIRQLPAMRPRKTNSKNVLKLSEVFIALRNYVYILLFSFIDCNLYSQRLVTPAAKYW